MPGRLRFISFITLASLCIAHLAALHAEQVLFIGNSYTSGGPDAPLARHGGIPRLVQIIALSKARNLSFIKLTPGGKDWGYDLKQPVTDAALRARPWDWVVLQDFSTQPTHIGNPGKFFEDGETFYRLIRESCPESKILLFETWAREKGHVVYTGVSTPKSFIDPAQMTRELKRSYTSLYRRLETLDTGNQLGLAPVGSAFALCQSKYPEIKLYWSDKHHPGVDGGYLAALVLYASIFQDSPKGATREFFGITLGPGVAEKLQEIAAEVTSPWEEPMPPPDGSIHNPAAK